ncbi:spore coat protein D [Sporosarcina sp. 6E9]|uniref:spore coat protein D n=1 Tax=Sporosarcina sp. 6E9 TaxID=2819235 RepID=UPI001B30F6D4|nr:spore coat protein D [Sporosarcina sp. 6E9]
MMHHGNCHGNQVQPIVCPPEYRFNDEYMPREIPVIHPIVNVNRHHYVDVPKHYYQETTEDVMGMSIGPGGPGNGYGPGGGVGPEFGGGYGRNCRRRGRSRWF